VTVPYTEGTLVIDLRDPTTRSLVWRAIASEEKDDPIKVGPDFGGRRGDRTPDLCIANAALSQLS
jgi:hypothetical protein